LFKQKLGTSETLQKTTVGFVISLSVRMEQLGPQLKEILIK